MRKLQFKAVSFPSFFLVPICLLFTGLGGCDTPLDPDDLPRAAVNGTVRLDGKPLDGIDIIFEGEEVGENGRRRAVHTTVRNGRYSLDQEDGPSVGRATVRFLDLPESREQLEAEINEKGNRLRYPTAESYPIPEKYATGSTLEVQIAPESTNTHDFDLQSS